MTDTKKILQILAKDFPNAKSELNFNSPFELIVAVILSAQCTDKRVNTVTPKLFEVAPTPQAMASLSLEQIEQIIRPCGFYHSKAQYLKQMATDIVNRFGGQVPNNLDDLQSLAGVGRKTANVVYAVAFGGQAIAVDTHVFRVSNRLGIANATNVLDTEKQLMQAIPQNEWADSHHYILLHGRYVCKAQNPNCTACSVQAYCKYYNQKQMELMQTESAKCLGCKKATCTEACPICNDISQVINLVKQNKIQQAVQTIGHPFGEICGYVCPQESCCKVGCILANKGNGVDFPLIERTIFAQHPFEWKAETNLLQGKRIAVVGGGVAGITFACQVYRNGASVTIFEQTELLSTIKQIPNYRLPSQATERVIQNVPTDVVIKNQTVDGFSLKQLQNTFDFVYVATGNTNYYTLGVEGEQYATSSAECLKGNVKGKVLVIGGGNTAMDCATLSKKLGCDVTVVYRRTIKDMPAFASEIAFAKKQGVLFQTNLTPTKLQKTKKGLVLTVAKTISQGRGKLEITNDTQEIACDVVVCATGGKADKSLFDGALPTANEVGKISPNTFIGGDILGGKLVAQGVQHAINTANYILNKR